MRLPLPGIQTGFLIGKSAIGIGVEIIVGGIVVGERVEAALLHFRPQLAIGHIPVADEAVFEDFVQPEAL
jgi:hypothetical protein